MVKRFLLKRNMVLTRPPGQFNASDWKLQQIKRRGWDLKVIIDGGAAEGSFTQFIKGIYPEAKVIAIEPRPETQAKLTQVASNFRASRSFRN